MRFKTMLKFLPALLLAMLPMPRSAADSDALLDPAKHSAQAPDEYSVRFETSKGDFVLDVTRDWAPIGADRFYNLVKAGFYDEQRFFRVVPNFVVQWGLHGDPAVTAVWRQANIDDDPVKATNEKGYITYAMAGPNTRTSQVFINLRDNKRLDGMGFAPFGKVASGIEVVEALYNGYGDGPPGGRGPQQGRIVMQGNSYLTANFPELDYIKKATIVELEEPGTD